jgi:hypothetical protein
MPGFAAIGIWANRAFLAAVFRKKCTIFVVFSFRRLYRAKGVVTNTAVRDSMWGAWKD